MPKLLEFKVQKEIVRFSAIFLLIFLFSIFKGSGWCWLIHSPVSKKLELITTPNQDQPQLYVANATTVLGVRIYFSFFF